MSENRSGAGYDLVINYRCGTNNIFHYLTAYIAYIFCTGWYLAPLSSILAVLHSSLRFSVNISYFDNAPIILPYAFHFRSILFRLTFAQRAWEKKGRRERGTSLAPPIFTIRLQALSRLYSLHSVSSNFSRSYVRPCESSRFNEHDRLTSGGSFREATRGSPICAHVMNPQARVLARRRPRSTAGIFAGESTRTRAISFMSYEYGKSCTVGQPLIVEPVVPVSVGLRFDGTPRRRRALNGAIVAPEAALKRTIAPRIRRLHAGITAFVRSCPGRRIT